MCHLPADDPEECRLVARDRVPTFLPLGLLAHVSEARVRQRAGYLHARARSSMSPPQISEAEFMAVMVPIMERALGGGQ